MEVLAGRFSKFEEYVLIFPDELCNVQIVSTKVK